MLTDDFPDMSAVETGSGGLRADSYVRTIRIMRPHAKVATGILKITAEVIDWFSD